MKKYQQLFTLFGTFVMLSFMGCSSSLFSPTSSSNTTQRSNTQTGAVLGGILGAAIGGGSADQSSQVGTRAAIGGVLGTAVGAAVGYSLDQQAQEVAQVLHTEVDNTPMAEHDYRRNLVVSNTEKHVKIMFRDKMMFATNVAVPTPSAQREIQQMIPVLQKYPKTIIQVVGHTDSRGTYAYNLELSKRRANEVGRILKRAELPNRLYVKGCSFSKPLVPNTSAENMALNRRVEIYLYPNQASVVDPCQQ